MSAKIGCVDAFVDVIYACNSEQGPAVSALYGSFCLALIFGPAILALAALSRPLLMDAGGISVDLVPIGAILAGGIVAWLAFARPSAVLSRVSWSGASYWSATRPRRLVVFLVWFVITTGAIISSVKAPALCILGTLSLLLFRLRRKPSLRD